LIGVTNFFRDPEAFETLQNKVLPKLLAHKPEDYTLRVWIPGCATGEEAYSIAIVLNECMEQIGRHFHLQIFGTDIDADAIDTARAGVYPESILADVGGERIKRYFTHDDDGRYRVKKPIRETLVFAPQNVIKDPPFTKLDLLCCRNLLIYLDTELQRKLLPIFHYGLKPDGILFLGSSETIGPDSDLFALSYKKWKIYRRKATSATANTMLGFPTLPDFYEARDLDLPGTVQRAEGLSAMQMVETILHQSDAPPCAIVTDSCNVVYIHGRTGRYLEPAEGKASVNIVEMARKGLKAELAAAIRQVATQKQETVYKGLRVDFNGGELFVDLTVKPVLERSAMHGLMMVIFEETATPSKSRSTKPTVKPVKRSHKTVVEIEEELQYTKESLQSTIEELETSNEELKSTNEELQSTNEELQSTNEELETSKEELQSLNEESATVNNELQSRIDELSRTNDDMKNLLDSTDIATIFLDTELCCRRFTPKATAIIPLTATDAGRPIEHLASTLKDVNVADYGRQVLKNLCVQRVEVESRDGRFYAMCVRPYRTLANVIDGVVVTFEDITEFKEAAELRRLAIVVRDSNDAITLLDTKGQIISWNRGAENMYGYSEAEALKMNIADIVPPERIEETVDFTERAFRGELIPSFETKRLCKEGRIVDVWLTATLVSDDKQTAGYIATTERDITDLKRLRDRKGSGT